MPSEWENNSTSSSAKVSSSSGSSLSASSSTATSPEPNSNGNNNNNNDSAKNGHAKDCALKASTMSHDPTPYVARARVTRPTPPKPSCNPMQFVQIKPCNLYQSAQQQLKKVEEIKKVKEVLKEEPEDWQNNLDNWKSSRRKRVEHIIERVVEVKKLELEEHDRTRRKSKTFSEMMEERGERGRTRPKLQSLASYNEDEANDLSDLGIGTSSASGKSSISEDCEVHSIVSEPPDVDHLSSFDIENNSCQPCQDNLDRISSLGGYETSSTAPITSPDPYEYTYEGAIEDYKSRVSKASAASSYKKSEFDRKSTNLIDHNNDSESTVVTVKKEDLPKIDISKKRELFENQEVAKVTSTMQNHEQMEKKPLPSEFTNVRSIKDRLCSLEKKPSESNTEEQTATTDILPGEIYSIKERLQCLNQHNSVNPKPNINKVVAEVVAVPPLKDRLSSLQNAVTKEEVFKKPVVLVDEYQLEMLKNEDMARRQLESSKDDSSIIVEKAPSDDSGINTTDEKIDQEPATTEDEDDDDITVAPMTAPISSKYEEKVPSSATSNNEFQGEFDSSVSSLQLKNLNTPTVVSLVDKPVVVNDDHDDDVVGGGGGVGKTLFNSSKVVVNPKNIDDEVNCEVNHAQNLLKMFKLAFNDEDDVIKESVKSNQVEVELETLGSNVISKGLPNKVEGNIPKAIENSSNIAQGYPKVKVAGSSINPGPVVVKNENSLKAVGVSIKPKKDEEQNILKKTSLNSRFGASTTPESDLNVVLNIDNSHNKTSTDFSPSEDVSQHPTYSKNSVSSKVQQLNKISFDSQKSPSICDKSQKFENQTSAMLKSKTQQQLKPSSPIPLITPPSTHEGSESPPKFISVSSQVQQLNSLSASANQKSPKASESSRKFKNSVVPSVNSKTQQQLQPSSPISTRTPSPSADNAHKHPIYENIDIPHENASRGLKKVSNSENNGRVEIFNSKSMPEKPKSPEVLPRLPENRNANVQSKDFQQSALNDFIKDLETTYQPVIVEENVNNAGIVPEKNSQITIEDSENALYNPKTENVTKPKESQKLDGFTEPLQTKPIPLPRNLAKNTTEPMSPLPLDTCVDILQSFLAAERSYNVPANEPQLVKSPNELNSHPSDSFARLESVVEVPCSKLDVKDLPDPYFIRTPCISVDCEDKLRQESLLPSQALVRDSISSAGDSSPSSEITVIFKSAPESPESLLPSQALVRDSISSAGDSSPSSEITVIFKSAPESPTPNKSSLMEIANRMGSPIAARRDPLARQKPVCEKPCLKIDVKDLPDPNFIRTECIDVDTKSCCTATPMTPSTPGLALQKTNADILKKTCEDLSTSPPLSPVLGARNSENPNFMIARVEVVETKIKVTTTNDAEIPPAVPTTAPPPVPSGSSKNKDKPKTTQNSKPKNIFEFLKKNFQSKSESTVPEGDEFEPISVDNSRFYVPSDVISANSSSSGSHPSKDTRTPSPVTSNNGVNIEITKKITSDAIVEQSDSDLHLTDEINEILDEEISKLVVEDAKL